MPSYHGLIRAGETAAIVELIKSLRDAPNRPVEVPLPVGPVKVTPLRGAKP
jgi:hypothetical protein